MVLISFDLGDGGDLPGLVGLQKKKGFSLTGRAGGRGEIGARPVNGKHQRPAGR